jgi:hypothetical protein
VSEVPQRQTHHVQRELARLVHERRAEHLREPPAAAPREVVAVVVDDPLSAEPLPKVERYA